MPKIIDKQEKKKEIVRHAWQSISDYGIKGMSVRKIAEEAGMSPGQMRYYFPDHQTLLTAVMEEVVLKVEDRIKEFITSDLTIQEKIIQSILATLPLDDERYADMEVWTAYHTMSQEKGKDTLRNDTGRLVQMALQLLDEAHMLAEFNRELVSLRAVALIDGLAMQKLWSREAVPNEQIEEIIRCEVRSWLKE
ncbi:TetR/AcrR family transcriptional regulator [Macrococcus lamae]|uniref:TetR/AcrR family transcriptional regulator n=1 Tax=Macrococcus lamae TaxID=198484 RepID=A0A4V3BF26_9STAP|nr:TetR/AcrR family transcriptional regulator [Macrococcus lamae]TDM07516.1 TetR/AcrR family transcriptional regulator [Macrococcus lamae]